jgi:hypothetical protein
MSVHAETCVALFLGPSDNGILARYGPSTAFFVLFVARVWRGLVLPLRAFILSAQPSED